jgi:hypothetical protein
MELTMPRHSENNRVRGVQAAYTYNRAVPVQSPDNRGLHAQSARSCSISGPEYNREKGGLG